MLVPRGTDDGLWNEQYLHWRSLRGPPNFGALLKYVRRTRTVVNGLRISDTEAPRAARLSVLDKATIKRSAREEGGLLI